MRYRQVIEAEIAVSWCHRVFFTRGAWDRCNTLLAELIRGSKHASGSLVVLDTGFANRLPSLSDEVVSYFKEHDLTLAEPPLMLSGGEHVKNEWHQVNQIYAAFERARLCRQSTVIAVGGGALLDVAGFAAATAHRGLRHIRLPTTSLAQADAGVGMKNGVNAFGRKNFIGTFAPPFAVVNDLDALTTLPEREKRCGYAEAVKVALIRDPEFLNWIESHADALAAFETASVETLVRRCAELHVRHIATSGDPFEKGSARPLDFGHWSAHKLEQLSGHQIRHGEAVALGVALDTLYSARAGLLAGSSAERVMRLLQRLGFALFAEEMLAPELMDGLEEFREHLGGELTLTLLDSIGSAVEVHEIDGRLMKRCIRELHDLA